jgi:S1-C subfamily serine protease
MLTMSPLLLLLLAAPPDPTLGAAKLPAELRWGLIAGCVRVSAGDAPGKIASAVCVGVRDGHVYLLSSAHAIPADAARVYEFFSRDTYPTPVRTVAVGEIVLTLTDPDLALVKVPIGREPVSVLRLAPPGKRPKRFPCDAVSVGCPDGLTPVCRAERLTAKKLIRRPGDAVAFFWEAEQAPTPGMSGGPLVNLDGRVIGICAAASDNRAYFTHADEVLAALKTAGYGWLFAE